MWRERQGGEKYRRGSGEVEIRWKPRGNQTTTNRRSTKTSTTFCVFLLTEYFLPLILRIQIRGTWKRQADRIGDEKGPCGLGHEAARVLSEKIEREYLLRARISGGARCCQAECEPPATGRALAFRAGT